MNVEANSLSLLDRSIHPSMDSFPLDFQNYLTAEGYSIQEKKADGWWDCSSSLVCSPDPIHQDKINSLFTHGFTHSPVWWFNCLCQFWTAEEREDRWLLTTRNQPFFLRNLDEDNLCKYRMACKDYEFNLDSDVEEGGLGIVGRVFRHRSIEISPNVEYYTIQQYPLRDVAQSCEIKSLIAIPVFEPSSLRCVGVLEFVGLSKYPGFTGTVNDICKALREVGLESPIVHANHYETHINEKIKKAVPPALKEIRKTLTESCRIRGVHFCQAWAPCTSCKDVFNGDAMMRVLYQKEKEYYGHEWHFLSYASLVYDLRKGQGVAGKAFSSGKLSLCTDTSQLNIIDYPLAHFVRKSKLNGCFAICLQSNHTGNKVYVLEFLFEDFGDLDTLLCKILEGMKKHLVSFKVASGQELGAKLPIIIIDSQMNETVASVQIPAKRELFQQPIMNAMATGRNDVIHEQSSIPDSIQRIEERASTQQPSMYTMATRRNEVIQDPNNIPDFVQIPKEAESVHQHSMDTMMLGRNDGIPDGMSNMNEKLDCIQSADGEAVQQCLFGQPLQNPMNTRTDDAGEDPNGILNSNSQRTRTTETVGKQCRKSGIPIPLEDIQQQFGKKLEDAATSLGVSRSTLKRACREYEIMWWQRGKRNCGYRAASNASSEDVALDQVLPPSSNMPYQPPIATGTSKMQNCIPLESTNNMDIKVMYGDKLAIKFQLSLSSGIAGLKQQVLKRLNGIDFGKYSFQYKDEENDWISIRCDEDLHHYLSSLTSSTKTLVTIYLKPFTFCLA